MVYIEALIGCGVFGNRLDRVFLDHPRSFSTKHIPEEINAYGTRTVDDTRINESTRLVDEFVTRLNQGSGDLVDIEWAVEVQAIIEDIVD